MVENTVLTGIQVMAHICAKNLCTYTLSRSTARAARNKVKVSYIEIIGIEFVIIWARRLTRPAKIKATRVGFPSGDLGLIVFFVSEASDASSILAL